MSKLCVFCRKIKDAFNEEHVFPAAIGGAFIINNVCIDCNSTLGQNIDNPFSRHEFILVNRHEYGLARTANGYKRNIPNPFSGKHKDDEGKEYVIEFNTDGVAIPRAIPSYTEPTQVENGYIGKLTISLDDLKSEEDAIKRYAKKFNLNPEELKIIETSSLQPKPINIRIATDNNIFIFGALKIAYEFTTTFIPEYLNDPLSNIFSKILLNKTVLPNEKVLFFDYDPTIQKVMTDKLISINGLQKNQHAILITTIPGQGLFCIVKIFTWPYIIRLSSKETYLNINELFLVNDFAQKAWGMNIPIKLTAFNINIMLRKVNRGYRRKILKLYKEKRINNTCFKTRDGNIPVFDNRSTKLCNHIGELINDKQIHFKHFDSYKKRIIVPINYDEQNFFLKYFKENTLVPFNKVFFIYDVLY